MKKINFILLGFSKKPIGGYRIIYQYSNELALRGYDVNIYFNCDERLKEKIKIEILRKVVCKLGVKVFPRWFKLNREVKKHAIFEISDNSISNADYVCATAIETAPAVNELSLNKGKKIYIIQDYENWKFDSAHVDDTFKYGMCNVVISNWLKEKVDKVSLSESILVPNSIDLTIFKKEIEIEDRYPHSIAILYHEGSHKGLKYAIDALEKLKVIYPDLKVNMFGVYKNPNIPNWIEYTFNASPIKLKEIYNSSVVFLCATIEEGFGLTGLESMACGCVVVSTRYRGILEYADDGNNSLLSPVKNSDLLVDNMIRVFEDKRLRDDLSKNAILTAKQRDLKTSIDIFEKYCL